MDGARFDGVARLLARRRVSRRAAVSAAGGAAVSALAAGRVTGQEATPPPTEDTRKTEFLFVQSFRAGRLTPKEDDPGAFVLALEQGLGQTIFFSDRPERIVGALPTTTFLQRLGFTPQNPPNAALVADLGNGSEEILVVELTSPRYVEETHTAVYDVRILSDYERVDMRFRQEPVSAAHDATEYGVSHLFIDDCPTYEIRCALPSGTDVGWADGPLFCWSGTNHCCEPCNMQGRDNWNAVCNQKYAACNGQCRAYVPNGSWCLDGTPGGPAPTCGAQEIHCAAPKTYVDVGSIPSPLFCLNEDLGCCQPCYVPSAADLDAQCNSTYPSQCNGGCTAYTPNAGWCGGFPSAPLVYG